MESDEWIPPPPLEEEEDGVPPPPPPPSVQTSLAQKVALLILQADALVFTTGAGMGVGSGLGTYRGKNAATHWGPKNHGLELDEISSPEWFSLPRLPTTTTASPDSSICAATATTATATTTTTTAATTATTANATATAPINTATPSVTPREVDPLRSVNFAVGFFAIRHREYTSTPVHEGYKALLKWSEGKLLSSAKEWKKPRFGCFSFTSNIDGHWVKSGISASRLLELHGSIEFLQCSPNAPPFLSISSSSSSLASSLSPGKLPECGTHVWSAACLGEVKVENYCAVEPLPCCPFCGAVARPNVLLFNDFDYVNTRKVTQYNNYMQWQQEVKCGGAKVLVLEIGAGTLLASVRAQSETLCSELGATMVRINPEHPSIDVGASWGVHISVKTWDSVSFLKEVDACLAELT